MSRVCNLLYIRYATWEAEEFSVQEKGSLEFFNSMHVHPGAFSIFFASCVNVFELQQPFGVNSIACSLLTSSQVSFVFDCRVLVHSDIVKSYAIFSHVMP